MSLADCQLAFWAAVRFCDPSARVAEAKRAALGRYADRTTYGIAIGKAALKMARGFGPVARGVVVTNADDGQGAPAGWHVMIGAHPVPDARSLAAGEAVTDLVAGARASDVIVALISGGASALAEYPAPGITLAELRTRVGALAASGAEIHSINRLRSELSAIKGGKLARIAEAPVVTMAVSDVYDDDLAVIGSGPTIADRPEDRATLIAPMQLFAQRFSAVFVDADVELYRVAPPLVGPIEEAVHRLLDRTPGLIYYPRGTIRYGEPTVIVPAQHGEGGRAQQLALALAREIRGQAGAFAFVAGSDGMDGPPPADRPAPAGAFVDGNSWDYIVAAGIDPARALARRDAGPALAAINALFITGPTGINHGDIMVVG